MPLFFGFTRQSNFLYSVGVFGRRMSASRLVLMFALWTFSFLLLLADINFLHASFPGGKLANVAQMLAQLDLFGAGRELAANAVRGAQRFFTSPEDGGFYLVARYVFVAATVYCLAVGFVRVQPRLLAAGMVGLAFFAALLTLYDVGDWRDLRSLAGVTVFLMVVLGQHRRKAFLLLVLLAQLATYPALVSYGSEFNNLRVIPFRNQVQAADAEVAAYKALSALPATRPGEDFILLSVDAGLFPTDMGVAYLSLPVRSDSGLAMRYTFQRYGLAGASQADYRLSAQPCPDRPAVLSTSFFQVCRLVVQRDP